MIKKLFLVSLLSIIGTAILVYCWSRYTWHTFTQIESFAQALPALECCQNTLILFDLDDTLISTADSLGHLRMPLSFIVQAIVQHPSLVYQEKQEYYFSMIWQQSEWFVIEPDSIQIIDELKRQGCTVLALTSMETGSFGVIKNFPEWRLQKLLDLGIQFSGKFPNVIFSQMPAHRKHHPELFNGILCCNQQSKGSVLAAFLDHFNLEPQKIIFFDDNPANLLSVEKTCIKKNIPFKGFHYQGRETMGTHWDTQRALLQLDYLIKHNQWLPDKVYLKSFFN
jgi:Protein of unknown function (DUF2608)